MVSRRTAGIYKTLFYSVFVLNLMLCQYLGTAAAVNRWPMWKIMQKILNSHLPVDYIIGSFLFL